MATILKKKLLIINQNKDLKFKKPNYKRKIIPELNLKINFHLKNKSRQWNTQKLMENYI